MKEYIYKYLYRPTDYTIFERLSNGKYTNQLNITNKLRGNEYKYENLIEVGFRTCNKKDLPKLEQKHKEYYKYIAWKTRPDGHGGSKGGNFQEYLEYKKLLKKYKDKYSK